MARQIQLRRGTAIQHTTFTGANGEVTVDTTNKTLRVHDGTTPGGTPLARADSVTDMSGADYVVAWQTPTDQNNYTWYRKYKSGLVDMGGLYYGSDTTINLPIPLANANYQVLLTKNSAPAYWATTNLTVSYVTNTSFTISQFGDNASLKMAWLIINALSA